MYEAVSKKRQQQKKHLKKRRNWLQRRLFCVCRAMRLSNIVNLADRRHPGTLPCGHKMLLLPHREAQFKHKEQQARRNQLKLSDRILAARFHVWAVWRFVFFFFFCASVFAYCCCSSFADSPRVPEGNVTHYVPCYWYPTAKGRDEGRERDPGGLQDESAAIRK